MKLFSSNNKTTLTFLYICLVLLLIILSPIAFIGLYIVAIGFIYKSYKEAINSLEDETENQTPGNIQS